MQKNFVVYKSSAGSGKTFTLVKEYLKIALTDNSVVPTAYKKILALTFTNKAAAEMKFRIIDALKSLAGNNKSSSALLELLCKEMQVSSRVICERAAKLLSEILHNYSDFSISTIDSFTHKIVKTFAHDLKLPVSFTIETNTEDFYQRVVSGLFSKIGSDPDLTKLLLQYTTENTSENNSWDPEQRLLEFTNLMKTENAGIFLGKLNKLSKSELTEIKQKLHAFTSSFKKQIRDAGKRAVSLIEQKKLNDANFIYGKAGPQQVFYKWAYFRNGNPAETYGSRFTETIGNSKWAAKNNSPEENDAIAAITDELNSIAKNTINYIQLNNTSYNLFQLIEKNIYSILLLNELELISNEFRTDEQIIFISEFNGKIAEIVANEPAPFIYERMGERYQHFLLDEFQDTSSLQWFNLLPLIDNSLASGKYNLIVGDGKQSIYRWRNANVQQFNALPEISNPTHNPIILERALNLKRNYKEEILDTNFRSRKNIVEFNNSFFGFLPEHLLQPEFRSIYHLQAQKTNTNSGGYISIQSGDCNSHEIEEINYGLIHNHIAAAISSGYVYSDICIIIRSNAHGNMIANNLTQHHIPVISSDSLLLKNNTEINCMISFLTYLNNPYDLISAAAVIQFCCKNKTDLPVFFALLQKEKNLFKVLYHLAIPLTEKSFQQKNIFDCCLEIIKGISLGKNNPVYLRFFLDEVNDFMVNKTGSLNDFLIWWEKRKEQASLILPEGTNAVKIMTIHRSKGLEFPVVILPFVNWEVYKTSDAWVNLEKSATGLPAGVFTISKKITDAGFGEIYELEKNEQFLDNLNLLYVAFTRAVDRLHIICNKPKKKNKETVSSWITNYVKQFYPLEKSECIEIGTRSEKHHTTSKRQLKGFDISSLSIHPDPSLIKIKGSGKLKLNEVTEDARENGIKMHYILSEINSIVDIETVLMKMIAEGIISSKEKTALFIQLKNILSHEIISSYYSPGCNNKNEAEIITESGEILRPDRIIFENQNAVVIDYKTGKQDSKKHAFQMEKYSDALLKMGYGKIRKILVYLEEDSIVELS